MALKLIAMVTIYIVQYLDYKDFSHLNLRWCTLHQFVPFTFSLTDQPLSFQYLNQNVFMSFYLQVCTIYEHTEPMCAHQTFPCLLSHLLYVYIAIYRSESYLQILTFKCACCTPGSAHHNFLWLLNIFGMDKFRYHMPESFHDCDLQACI